MHEYVVGGMREILQLKLSDRNMSVIHREALLMNPVCIHHPAHILRIVERSVCLLHRV